MIAIVSFYLAAILLVDPRGEFPLNDDWSYTRSAFRLASGQGLRIDEWAAPSLAGQALYGGLLASVFGQHFLVLRLSTLALSCATALILWLLFRDLRVPAWESTILLLTWILNPIQFCLSFSFMTEVPFLFFIALGIYLYFRWLSRGGSGSPIAAAVALGYAYTIRQTALLFIIGLVAGLILRPGPRVRRDRLASAAICAAIAGAFVAAYQGWILFFSSATPATQRKFELLGLISGEQVIGNCAGLLFYVSFMLLPLAVRIAPMLARLYRSSGPVRLLFAVGFWTVLSAGGFWWFRSHYAHLPYLPSAAFHSRMPYLLNVLYDTGLGPITLDPTYYGPPPTPTYPHLWLAVTVITALALVILGSAFWLTLGRAWSDGELSSRRGLLTLCLLSFVAVLAFETVFSHRQEGGLFDRHILTAALPALLLGALANSPSQGFEPGYDRRRTRIAAGTGSCLILGALGWFCVAATHDYLAWNRLRWTLGNDLLVEGADPLTFSGGFEFNAWHNYDTFRARGNIRKIHHWWYDEPRYVIAMEPQERFHIVRGLHYYSWLHRRSQGVYLLAAEPGDPSRFQRP